ncbi:MAG: DsbA family protein [Minisyncoccota bacterium]
MKSSLTIPLAIVLGGIIVAVALYISVPKRTTSTGDPTLVRPVSSSDHILGNPAARVMVVEYADFDCEYCKNFNSTLRQVIATEGATGQVALVYREFPLTEIHPNALALARAAECIAEIAGNDTFWKFADSLFANQPVDPANVGTLAQATGVSGNTFAACYADAATTVDTRIMADRQNALAIGARGTPYSLILATGAAPVVMDGAYSYDAVKQLVDQALGK